jgi:hypothetical protein
MTFKSNLIKLPIVTLLTLVMLGFIIVSSAVEAADPLPERPIAPVVLTVASLRGSKIILKAPVHMATEAEDAGGMYDADDWTVVQWQAVNGVWYDVDGWQGTFFYDADLDADHWRVEWWVGSENLRKENFRWSVYEDESKEKLKQTSALFDMPKTHRTAVVVTVEN